jgi:hypothetical protein
MKTKAEYVGISEVFKEVKIVYYLLCDFHIKEKLPRVVRKDNVGAIFTF